MPRTIQYDELEQHERIAALMTVAGCTPATIALFLGTDTTAVGDILTRPRVKRYLMGLDAAFARGIENTVRSVNEQLEDASQEAFDTNLGVMRDLRKIADHADDPKVVIKALSGCAVTAQDILNRAGKRAPEKSVHAHVHAIAPQSIEHLGRVMAEMKTLDVLETITPTE